MSTETHTPGMALFVSRRERRLFVSPVETVVARSLEEVMPCLELVSHAVDAGLHAAGFLAYEAALAFDPALATHPSGELPLLWFGLYRDATVLPSTASRRTGSCEVGSWQARVSEAEYRASVERIREWIVAGDTYQTNYTIPLETSFSGDALAWFEDLAAAQRADHCAFLDADRFKILSASPELHFRIEGDVLETRPMKGTRRRGRWSEEDRQAAQALAASEKDRAENVMIVDLLRNDMGRVSEIGSVRVTRLFDVERYETVWQMTSTIESQTRATVPELLSALFPSGSVTGAPKSRTMAIIREVEPEPRGVYCGSIGWWSPGRRAEFNVAIRTVTVDTETGRARYSVGGGITWGSTPEGEYDECLAKAAVLHYRRPSFRLLESIGFDGEYRLLEGHLQRLQDSADYFGFAVDLQSIGEALTALSDELRREQGLRKVRLTVGPDATFHITHVSVVASGRRRVALAKEPVDESDVFLYHKTTHRAVYERAAALRPGFDDVLLFNRRGELTESTMANLVLDLDGTLCTPPLDCGLLPGVLRESLLLEGKLVERVLTPPDLIRANAVWLINSVRGWMPADYVEQPKD